MSRPVAGSSAPRATHVSVIVNKLDPPAPAPYPILCTVASMKFDPSDESTRAGLTSPWGCVEYKQLAPDSRAWVTTPLWTGKEFPIAKPTYIPGTHPSLVLWSSHEIQVIGFGMRGVPISQTVVQAPQELLASDVVTASGAGIEIVHPSPGRGPWEGEPATRIDPLGSVTREVLMRGPDPDDRNGCTYVQTAAREGNTGPAWTATHRSIKSGGKVVDGWRVQVDRSYWLRVIWIDRAVSEQVESGR